MANTTKAAVLDHLRKFKHASRTNLAKKQLTNHDTCAYVVWSLGPTPLQELVEIMMTWRFGKATWRTEKNRVWVWDRNGNATPKFVTRRNPKMGFDYLFNASVHGGYGFVAPRAHCPGNYMHSHVYGAGKFRDQEEGWKAFTEFRSKTFKASERDERDGYCVFFRRTYWHRTGKGVYGPTLECAKRIVELNGLKLH